MKAVTNVMRAVGKDDKQWDTGCISRIDRDSFKGEDAMV
jgi:hypothetical protein